MTTASVAAATEPTPPEDLPPIVDIETAARRVVGLLGTPLHERATVAALESEGVRNVEAGRIAPGCRTVFELGALVHRRAMELPAPPGAPQGAAEAVLSFRRVLSTYGRALAYSLPLVAQIIALVALGVSLWGSARLSAGEQTGIALGVVVSLLLTGPLTQAMVRRVYYYWFQGDVRAARRVAIGWMGIGIVTGLAGSGAVAAIAATRGGFSDLTLSLGVVIGVQCAMWLGNAVLATISRGWFAGIAIFSPAILVWAGLRADWSPLLAHAVGMAAATVLLLAGAWWFLGRMARGWPAARRPLPRAVAPLEIAGYAAWGIVYSLLFFGDRLVAWLGGGGDPAFQPLYETALEMALVPLLLVQPLLEIVLVQLNARFIQSQDRTPAAEIDAASRAVGRSFVRLVAAAGAAYAAIAAVVWIVAEVGADRLPFGVGDLMATTNGRLTLAAALVAYGCLAVAVGLCSAFQLFSRPWPMVAMGGIAVAVNLTVGLIARVAGPPEAASLGLLAGSVVFLVGMGVVWTRASRNLDHMWYAAF